MNFKADHPKKEKKSNNRKPAKGEFRDLTLGMGK